jgi:hypothetical protein
VASNAINANTPPRAPITIHAPALRPRWSAMYEQVMANMTHTVIASIVTP